MAESKVSGFEVRKNANVRGARIEAETKARLDRHTPEDEIRHLRGTSFLRRSTEEGILGYELP